MAEDVAELKLKVDSKQIKQATRDLDKLGSEANQAEKATDGVTKSFGALKGAISVAAIVATGAAIAKVADQYQQLNARLVTATGSQENATEALEDLRNLAFEMPGSIEDVTNSFIQLTNLGLNPSQEALISYGNTAAAMGKDLSQLIEAVADAATGEFERLKEFGIKSRNEGDKIAFTFRGVTTRVGNSAQEIENFLIGLGQNEFAGAMEAQNETLGASFTDLADTIGFATAKLAEETGFTKAVTAATNELGLLIRKISDTETLKDHRDSVEELTEQQKFWNEQIQKAQELAAQQEEGGLLDKFFGPKPELILAGAQANLVRINEELRAANAELKTATATQKEQAAAQPEKAVDLTKQLDKIRKASTSRLDIARNELFERQLILDEARMTEQISEEEHQQLMTSIHKEYAEQRAAVNEKEQQARVGALSSMFGNLSSLMNSENKKHFEIGKKAAIAQTVIETYSAAQKAYSSLAGIPIVGPALGIAAAAAAITAGGVRVQAIQSTQFGGGGAPSAGGGGGAPSTQLPPMPTAPEPSTVGEANIVVSGGLHSDEDVRNMINRIAEVQQDMGGAVSFNVS